MKQNYNGVSLKESKKLNTSLGRVTISNDDGFTLDYAGCVYKEKKYFATLIPDIFYDKTTHFEVTVGHLKRPIPATVVYRSRYGSGITVLELPGDKCKSLNPLYVETENEVKLGDDIYLPNPYYTDGIVRFTPLKVCPFEGFLFINSTLGGGFFGSPILNSRGKLIGMISLIGELPEKEMLELESLWNPLHDTVRRSQAINKISDNWPSLPIAYAFDMVPCEYEQGYQYCKA